MRHPESAVLTAPAPAPAPAPVSDPGAPAASSARGLPRRRLADDSDDQALAQVTRDEAEAQPPLAESQASVIAEDGSRDEGHEAAAVIAGSDEVATGKSAAAMVGWLVGATLTAGSTTFLAGGSDRGGSPPPPNTEPLPEPKPESTPETPLEPEAKPEVPSEPQPTPQPDPKPPRDDAPPAVLDVHLLHDTGVPGDRITHDARVRVSGLEAGAHWESSRDGRTWTAGTGDTIAASEFAGDGNKRVQVRQIDAAGHVGPESTLSFRLDTTIADPTATLRSAARDHYPLANEVDFHAGTAVNRDTWLQLGLEDRARWTYSINGGQDHVPGEGDRLRLDVLEGEGRQEVRIRQQDEAGNWSGDTVLELMVDNTAPVVTATYSPAIATSRGVLGKVQSYDFQADEDVQIVFVPVGAVHGETPQSHLAGWQGKGLLAAGAQTTVEPMWREQPANAMYLVLAVDKAGNVSFVPMSGADASARTAGTVGTAPAAVVLDAGGQFAENHVATATPDPLDGRSIARSTRLADHLSGSDRADVFSWRSRAEAPSPQVDWIHGYNRAQGDVIEVARVPANGGSSGELGRYLRKEVLADGTVSLWIDYDGKGETFPGNFDQQILVTSPAGTELLLRLGQTGAPVVI